MSVCLKLSCSHNFVTLLALKETENYSMGLTTTANLAANSRVCGLPSFLTMGLLQYWYHI